MPKLSSLVNNTEPGGAGGFGRIARLIG